jgi:peptidoglycan-associated lipoprotein
MVSVVGVVLLAATGCSKKTAPTDITTDKPSTWDTKTESTSTTGNGTGGTDAGTIAPLALNDIYFDYDAADIRYDARSVLDGNAGQLEAHSSARVLIEGHCDERGTPEYNLALGQRRASSTMQYLVRKGIDAGRLSIVSYGEEQPVDPGHSESAWEKNRRAHFVVQR